MEKWMSNKLDQSVKFTEAHMIFFILYVYIYLHYITKNNGGLLARGFLLGSYFPRSLLAMRGYYWPGVFFLGS